MARPSDHPLARQPSSSLPVREAAAFMCGVRDPGHEWPQWHEEEDIQGVSGVQREAEGDERLRKEDTPAVARVLAARFERGGLAEVPGAAM